MFWSFLRIFTCTLIYFVKSSKKNHKIVQNVLVKLEICKLSSCQVNFRSDFHLGFVFYATIKKPSWENDFLTTFKLTLHCSFVMKIFLLRYILWSNTLLHKMNNAWNSCQLVGDHTFRAHPDVGPFSIIISWLLLLVRRL